MAAYTLVVMTNPVAGKEDEYNNWYSNQHLADVLRIPGFTEARRFKVGDGPDGPKHKYLALYEMETDNPPGILEELTKRAGTDAMPISPAMDMDVGMYLYEQITPLKKA